MNLTLTQLSGMCCFDGACADLNCPGRALAIEADSKCSTCKGDCSTPEACWRPIADIQPIRRRLFGKPSNRDAWGRAIGAAMALGGLVLLSGTELFHRLIG